MHPDIKCMSIPDNLDDTTFLVHPVAPAGLQLGELKGTADYDMAKEMIISFRDSLSMCNDRGKFGLAKYPWLDATDHKTMVCIDWMDD